MKKSLVPVIGFLMLFPGALLAGGTAEDPAGQPSAAGPGSEDYLKIAALMIRDGNLDRAETALEMIDPDHPGTDLVRLYTLTGILALYREDYTAAAEAFDTAAGYGDIDREMFPYLAYAYFMTGEYTKATEAAEGVEDLMQQPEMLILLIRSLQAVENHRKAFALLEDAMEVYPQRSEFHRLRISLLSDLHLPGRATAGGRTYLDRVDRSAEAYLFVGETLRRAGAVPEALPILEEGLLQYPDNADLAYCLGECYDGLGSSHPAGQLFARAAGLDSRYAPYAADFFSRRGRNDRALYFADRIEDGAERLKQRFYILVRAGEYERALVLDEDLAELFPEDDPRLTYYRAYMHYRLKNNEQALRLAKKIPAGSLDRQREELLQALEGRRD